jgi:hypothetical protein
MNDMPLFYRSIIPLNCDIHRAYGLSSEKPYAFAASSHLVPAVIDEFPAACADIPILFATDADGPAPVFLCGLAPGGNVFVTADGGWAAPYVPAYLRRYPFILGEVKGAEPLICFDNKSPVLRPEADDRTMSLFKPDGGDSDRLAECIKLVGDYAASAKRTQALSKALQELKLLQPITIQNTNSGRGNAIHGLLAVNEPAFNALPDKDFLRLRTDGMLAAIYTHLVSLRAIDRLSRSA